MSRASRRGAESARDSVAIEPCLRTDRLDLDRRLDDAQVQQLSSDHEPLDLARPLPDLSQLRVAQEALNLVFLDVAVAAVDLDRGVGHSARDLRGEQLGLRPRDRVVAMLVL